MTADQAASESGSLDRLLYPRPGFTAFKNPVNATAIRATVVTVGSGTR